LDLARPSSNGESLEDIVVDLAGSGAIHAIAELAP
jgi:hypothetical protein